MRWPTLTQSESVIARNRPAFSASQFTRNSPRSASLRAFSIYLAPFVAYAWYSGKPYARSAAILWNLFGMADLVNAVVLGALTNGGAGGIVFPLVLIPAYGVPRALLIHSYSLIGLLRKTSQQPRRAESLPYGMDAARA